MKVIIVGATGFIGSAILQRAISSPEITSIVTLSRRELPKNNINNSSNAAKLKNVLVTDFGSYSPEVLKELEGAEICIWAMGGRVSQFPDLDAARKANVEYLHAAAEAFVTYLVPGIPPLQPPPPPPSPQAGPGRKEKEKKKFRFVYTSGMFTEYDQGKKLLFLEDSRKLKGAAESGLLEIEKRHAAGFEVFIARPAGVLETDKGWQNVVYGSMGIGKGELAAAMVDIALNGAAKQVTESLDLRRRGKELLGKQ